MQGLDPKLLAKLKEKIHRELINREKEVTEYWLNELIKVYQKNHHLDKI